jgi:hypothetical protein
MAAITFKDFINLGDAFLPPIVAELEKARTLPGDSQVITGETNAAAYAKAMILLQFKAEEKALRKVIDGGKWAGNDELKLAFGKPVKSCVAVYSLSEKSFIRFNFWVKGQEIAIDTK